MTEHLVRDDEQHVILRDVEREKFSGSIEDAERESGTAAFCPELVRDPAIFGGRKKGLKRDEILRASRRRHV